MNASSTGPSRPEFTTLVDRTRRASYNALVVAVVIVIIGLVALFEMRRSARWVTHTHNVIDAIGQVVTDVRDVNFGTSSYLLTGDTVWLSAYYTGESRLRPDVRRMEVLVRDNPTQHRRMARLDSLVTRKVALIDEQLFLQRTYGADSASRWVRRGEGAAVMAEIRRVAAVALSDERALLVRRSTRMDHELWVTTLLVILGLGFTIYLVSATNGRLLRMIRARELAEAEAVREREHAETANRSKSEFLARMSHELRTPLNSVIGFANVMRKNKDGHLVASDLTYLDRIQANGRHLLSLINQILDLSKIEAGRVELVIESVDVPLLAADVIAQFEPQARERGLSLHIEAPDDLANVQTDGEKLRQILINLIGNAMKFTQEGSVTVAVHGKRGTVTSIDVRDTGIGIPRDRLAAVFEAFEQAESSTTRRYGGTGLGLSISRSLAQLMGLELTVDSEFGTGTTFTLIFPARASATPPRGTRTEEWRAVGMIDAELLHDRLILVIDDDADARVVVAQYLEDLDCRVIAATNGEQGLRVANRFTPDAIVLDIRMPGVDGWEVIRRLHADPALHHTPIVVVSIVATEQPAQAPPGVILLDKPCTRDDLAVALSRALQGTVTSS